MILIEYIYSYREPSFPILKPLMDNMRLSALCDLYDYLFKKYYILQYIYDLVKKDKKDIIVNKSYDVQGEFQYRKLRYIGVYFVWN